MEFIFFIDYYTGKKHIYKHNISVEEINEFFTESDYLRRKWKDGSYTAIAKLKTGRYIEVVYRVMGKDHLFVITAYDIEDEKILNFLENL